MPLQGSLAHLGLAEVLQTSLSGRKWGNLVLKRGADRALLHVAEEGLYLIEPDILDPEDVLQCFMARGILSPLELESARAEHPAAMALLDHFVEAGSVPQADLVDLLAGAAEDAIVDLLTWSDGEFRFDEGARLPTATGAAGRVAIDAGSLLLRAAQRIDERSAVTKAMGMAPVLFRAIAPEPPPASGPDDCAPAVFDMLDGTAVIEEVALRSGVGRFVALKAVLDLVQAGAVRAATPEEIASAVDARLAANQPRVARALLLQWAEAKPTDPTPLVRLAEAASARGRRDEEVDARVMLGNLYLRTNQAREALEAYDQALSIRPGDGDAVAGRRSAARACGDDEVFRKATMELAQTAIAQDDAERAAAMLAELPASALKDVTVRVLRARAFVRLKDRVSLVAEAEAIAELLGTRCRKRQEREAAGFCRDAVASLAPERSDLLRRFRVLSEGARIRSKRATLVGALVVVVATAGFLLWPDSPASLLAKARMAMETGNRSEASELIARLVEKYPDSAEAQDAFRLQNQAVQKAAGGKSTAPVDPATRKEFEAALPKWLEALKTLPAAQGRDALTAMAEMLERPNAVGLRPLALQQSLPSLVESLRVLVFEARSRIDLVARLRYFSAQGRRSKPDALREVLAEAQTYRQDGWVENLAATQPLFARLAALQAEDTLRTAGRELLTAARNLAGILKTHARDFDECQRLLAYLDVEAEYEASREDAPKLLVAGRLEDADAMYVRLQARLDAMAKDSVLTPVLEAAQKRQIPQFLRDRRGVIADIRRGMEAAAAAERAGDLAAAAQAYASLAKRFWMVRFENVFTVPVSVETVPAGARVFINGRDGGTTPVTIRYGWGSQTTLTFEAPGFEAATEQVSTADSTPRGKITSHLSPTDLWTAPVDATTQARPLAIDGDILVVDRGGRVTLLSGEDGRVLWTRVLKSLEGIRGRPAAVGRLVYVPLVDGRIHFLSAGDGALLSSEEVGRPVGDLAVERDTVAMATMGKRLFGYRGRARVFDATLSGDPTAGVLAAHGAFWVGTALGGVDRVDATTGSVRAASLGRIHAPILSLAATPQGILVTTGDGILTVLDTAGSLVWRTEGLGDLSGTAALSRGTVVASDHQGRVLLFDAKTGAPQGQIQAGSDPIGGLVDVNGRLVASLADGRLWIYDLAAKRAIVDSQLGGGSLRFPPGLVGGKRVVVPSKGCCAALIALDTLIPDPEPVESR